MRLPGTELRQLGHEGVSLRHTAVTNVYRAPKDLFLAQRFSTARSFLLPLELEPVVKPSTIGSGEDDRRYALRVEAYLSSKHAIAGSLL